ncbi:BMC domain-containing protein [Brevibacillus ginsengisoli]|uniref:BMC domain-containing protein n=1 Tax=Brevibacillus ginsengisoli TaxID=363854 RepID=UPI003CEEE4D8
MSLKALGLIEVRGYLGAIEAADSALKAANVTCIGVEKVKGGLVTVKLLGDVGAIRAAVEAGEKAAQNLGLLISSHVIARMHEETANLILPQEEPAAVDDPTPIAIQLEDHCEDNQDSNDDPLLTDSEEYAEETGSEADQSNESLPQTEAVQSDKSGAIPTPAHIIRGRSLQDMKVVELRRLARRLKIKTMTFNEIKFAKKDKLIAEIGKHMRGEESPWK